MNINEFDSIMEKFKYFEVCISVKSWDDVRELFELFRIYDVKLYSSNLVDEWLAEYGCYPIPNHESKYDLSKLSDNNYLIYGCNPDVGWVHSGQLEESGYRDKEIIPFEELKRQKIVSEIKISDWENILFGG